MGCVTSKHLRKQADADGFSPPRKKQALRPKSAISRQSHDHYRNHVVELTSTSYGLLSVDPLVKPAGDKDKATDATGSFTEWYKKLQSLKHVDAVSNTLGAPQANKGNQGWAVGGPARDSIVSNVPETIDVKDMMKGLEDDLIWIPLSSPKTFTSSSDICAQKTTPSSKCSKLVQNGFEDTLACDSCNSAEKTDTNEKENSKPFDSKHVPCRALSISRSPFGSTNSRLHTFQTPETGTKYMGNDNTRRMLTAKDAVILSSQRSSSPLSATRYPARDQKGKLNLQNRMKSPKSLSTSTAGISLSSAPKFTSAEPNSPPMFVPDLLATYEKALENASEHEWNTSQQRIEFSPLKQKDLRDTLKTLIGEWHPTLLDRNLYDPMECFEKKCPPGGAGSVVLYTTTLRGVRKTFEDCNNVRGILQSFCLRIDERDVSMHLKFLNELRELMGKVICAPRLFIKGRYIGGAEEVGKLFEDGKLGELVEGLPLELKQGICDGCGGVRFVPCLACSGSCKLVDTAAQTIRCPDCNENGLIQCPICT